MLPWEAEGFDWATERVIEKLADRRISQFQVEEVFLNGAAFKSNRIDQTGDWLMIGLTNRGRPLTVVVLVIDETRSLRPITGWDSSISEVDYFRRKRR